MAEELIALNMVISLYEDRIAELEADVTRLTEELANRPKDTEVDALKQQIAALEAQVNLLKREKEELEKRLTKTQDVISTKRQNEEHWQARYDYLVDAHAALEDELRKLQEALKQAVGDNKKNFRGLRDKIAQSAQEQIALANLADLADKGDTEGYNAVKVMCSEVQELIGQHCIDASRKKPK
jgi:chromosome segregation ATPase